MMNAMQQRFELIQAPQNPNDAHNLSAFITSQFGSQGWEIVSVLALGATLLIVMQKPFPIPN